VLVQGRGIEGDAHAGACALNQSSLTAFCWKRSSYALRAV
jgi:hypothetical protein